MSLGVRWDIDPLELKESTAPSRSTQGVECSLLKWITGLRDADVRNVYLTNVYLQLYCGCEYYHRIRAAKMCQKWLYVNIMN